MSVFTVSEDWLLTSTLSIFSGMNATISLLGDTALSQKSLFQIVAGVVGSSNELFGKSSTIDGIAHAHVVRVLAFDPYIQKLITQKHSAAENGLTVDAEETGIAMNESKDSIDDTDDSPVLISSSLSMDVNNDPYGCGGVCLPILAL